MLDRNVSPPGSRTLARLVRPVRRIGTAHLICVFRLINHFCLVRLDLIP